MEQKNFETFSCDIMLEEIIVDGSQVAEAPPVASPPISEEKKAFLESIDQAQRHYTGRSLSWGEIFDVLLALGYRKVEQSVEPPLPPQSNGDTHGDTRADGTANEKPS